MNEKKNGEELLQRAMHLCSTKEYCTYDIISKIGQWGETDEKTVNSIIDRLTRERFIDDTRYCRAFAIDHFRYQRWGKIKISAGLRMKKISQAAISEGLAAIDDTEYTETLRSLLETHRKSIKAKNRFDLKSKLLRYALGKGYESHLVYDIINSFFDE